MTYKINLSKKLYFKLMELRKDIEYETGEELDMPDMIEEAILSYFNISICDLNKDNEVIMQFDGYVYCILNNNKPGNYVYGKYKFEFEPLYIGSGSGNRINYYGKYDYAINHSIAEFIQDNKYDVKLLHENLLRKEAFRIESNLIYTIGRLDLGTGPLLNKSAGINYFPDQTDITLHNLEYHKNHNILKALNVSNTIKDAAIKLGISERSLYRKMKSLNLKKDDVTGLYHI